MVLFKFEELLLICYDWEIVAADAEERVLDQREKW
jgi:hypothetical protein